MKRKVFLFFFLLGMFFTCFAKQYVVIWLDSGSSSNKYYVDGSRPSGINSSYTWTNWGEMINLLADKGFELEKFECYGYGYGTGNSYHRVEYAIMSKSGTSQFDAIEVISEDDTEATEVARYNMQGLPVNENEKGVQIVVYSNFTAKVVIVQ